MCSGLKCQGYRSEKLRDESRTYILLLQHGQNSQLWLMRIADPVEKETHTTPLFVRLLPIRSLMRVTRRRILTMQYT